MATQQQPVTLVGQEQIPVLRQGAEDDGLDATRIKLVVERWQKQDMALVERDRFVEGACRVLMGDMWSVFIPALGRTINLADSLGAPELLYRELPRVNMCEKWFGLTLARLTENTPTLGAEPMDSDRESVMLADAMDVLLPKVWDDLRLSQKTFEIVGWMAAAGWGFHELSAETATGATVPMVGPAMLPAPDGSQVPVEHAAFDAQGQPMGRIVPGENGEWTYALDDAEEPGELAEGSLVSTALPPLQVRGEWGNSGHWQEKQWHIKQSFLTQGRVLQQWGIPLPGDTSVEGGSSATSHFQMRLERGPGHYGASDASSTQALGITGTGPATELVRVLEMWERPSTDFPEGRLLVVTGSKVLFDGPRPYPKLKDYGYTSPITYAPWMEQPGSPYGVTPLADGIPLNRQYNAGYRQLLLHRAKVTNPVLVYNAAIMTEEDAELFSRPGSRIPAEFSPAAGQQPPAFFISPADISADVYKIQDRIKEDFQDIMGLAGAEGIAQGPDASGEQVKELRFNSDRPISVPVKNLAAALEEIGNIAMCILPVIWPMEKVVHYVGDDNLARTMTILPEIWEGKCRVRIDAESMIPRSRQERENQALQRYQLMVYGQPGTPDAIRKYNEQSGYPDRESASGPGDIDRKTMSHLIGKVMQGFPAQEIPMLQQYNYGVMKDTLREHMAAPEFLKEDVPIQAQMQMLWQRIEQAEMVQAMMQAKQAAQVQGGLMQIAAPLQIAQAHVAGAQAQIAAPPEPPEKEGSSSASASKGD